MRTFAQKPTAGSEKSAAKPGTTGRTQSGQIKDIGPVFGQLDAPRLFCDFAGTPIQAKPEISEPGDECEREADAVADKVMRLVEPMPIGSCQSQENPVPSLFVPSVASEAASGGETSGLVAMQGVIGREEEYPQPGQGVVLRKTDPAPITAVISASDCVDQAVPNRAVGEPLPSVIRQRMEGVFGHDFSCVRVHHDSEADEASRGFQALAFTHGSDIYFKSGMYNAGDSSGRRLLAHELAHVVQQGQAMRRGRGIAPIDEAAQRSAPSIQRVATWAAGAVHETNNLAASVLGGSPVGVTWPTLNGPTFWGSAAARAALKKPTLAFSSLASGAVDAVVATVPTNTASFDETVLGAGPWAQVTPRGTVGTMFPGLAMCLSSGDTTFRAIGNPSDGAMFAANRRHENHHAADHKDAFDTTIVPWDAKLTAAEAAGTKFSGATETDAVATLHAAMGGTPDVIADAFMSALAAKVVAFHAVPAGGPVGVGTDPKANTDCSTSSAKFFNPS